MQLLKLKFSARTTSSNPPGSSTPSALNAVSPANMFPTMVSLFPFDETQLCPIEPPPETQADFTTRCRSTISSLHENCRLCHSADCSTSVEGGGLLIRLRKVVLPLLL